MELNTGKKIAISISGGGALGIGPLWYLKRLEELLGENHQRLLFDAFAGTSTGSIIVACMLEGMSASDIYELYDRELDNIFDKKLFIKRAIPKSSTYSNKNLIRLLQTNLRGKCSDWNKPFFIPATILDGKNAEKVWDARDDVEKWEAVLTSCSAPTYFDVAEVEGTHYADGGLWANDPIMCLECGLKRMEECGGTPLDSWKILSFNTGMVREGKVKGNQTLLGWASYILDEWVGRTGDSNLAECQVNMPVPRERIFRVAPHHSKIDMDDTSKKTRREVVSAWDEQFTKDLSDGSLEKFLLV